MKKFFYLVPVVLLLLSSCSALPTVAADATQDALTSVQLAQLQQTCTTAAPLLSASTGTSAPASVSSIAQFGAAYCAQLASGVVPPATTVTTPTWLSNVLNALQVAAKVAGFVLPLVSVF